MKLKILLLVVILVMGIAELKSLAMRQACFLTPETVCPAGSIQEGTTMVDGEIYTVCCANY